MLGFLRRYSLYFAWLVALIATLLSLYFSVVQKMPMCDLCWYQRICMYPLVILLGIAAYREDKGIVIYAMPLAILGILFSLYQYLEQMIPGFSPINLCSDSNCAQVDWIVFGFITISFLSIIANLVITFFLILSKYTISMSDMRT
jgi:disulfide bond formation protein DsbB